MTVFLVGLQELQVSTKLLQLQVLCWKNPVHVRVHSRWGNWGVGGGGISNREYTENNVLKYNYCTVPCKGNIHFN